MPEKSNATTEAAPGAPVSFVTRIKNSNSKRPFIVLSAVVGTLLLIFAVYWLATMNQESTNDAQIEADVAPISARVAGMVLRTPVRDHQKVKAGDLLVEIDSTDYAVKVKQAEAQVEAAEAQERIAEASSKGGFAAAKALLSGSALSVRNADAQVDAAKAALQRAQAENARAESDFHRYNALLADGSVTQSDFDRAKTEYESAQATVDQAQAQLAAAEEQSRMMESRVSEARGHVEQSEPVDAKIAAALARLKDAQAALEQARLQFSYTRITAPFDGALSKLAVRPGQYVQATQMVVELVPLASYIIANFKETQIGRMRPGQRVVVKIDAFPGRHFEGQIESMAPATGARFSLLPPDNASGNFVKVVQRVPVKIIWSRVSADLMPQAGLSAIVTVYLK